MAYRDVSESLRAYRDRVSADLDEARKAAKEAEDRAAKVRILEQELTETDGLLAKLGVGPRSLPLLENVAIAAPCSASWDEMVGDDRIRFCGHCEKNVYNLSALPRDEAEALLAAREGKMCIRLYKRQDGTVLTADCPVGVTKRRRRRAAAGVLASAVMSAGAMMATATARMGAPRPPEPVQVMGGIEAMTGAPAANEVPTSTGSVVPVMGAPPPVPPPVPPQVHVLQGVRPPLMGRPAVRPPQAR